MAGGGYIVSDICGDGVPDCAARLRAKGCKDPGQAGTDILGRGAGVPEVRGGACEPEVYGETGDVDEKRVGYAEGGAEVEIGEQRGIMKFMDPIFTQEGPGVVVAREKDGTGLLVELNSREVEVEPSPSPAAGSEGKKKSVMKTFPGRCVMMRQCEAHGVWFERRCELCQEGEPQNIAAVQ